jgi:hypothetical protein
MSGFGDFHSTPVMFWYQQVALSGSHAYAATSDPRPGDLDLGLNIDSHAQFPSRTKPGSGCLQAVAAGKNGCGLPLAR